MLASNYDRQSFLFNNSSNYKSDNDNFTHDDNGLIDEICFISCSPYTNDGQFHVYNNWSIKFKGMLNELAIGRVRSPCPNLTLFETGKDNLGHAIATYDEIFQNEREIESFYLESILQKMNDDAKTPFDPIKECRIIKTLATARKCLNDWGEKNNEPCSLISVDEDFYYMCGRCGANEDFKEDGKQSWPDRSLFMMRDWMTPSLNPTLSMTCKHARKVEVVKSILFQDPFESRKQFRTMSNNMVEKLHNVRHSQHLCCGCTYETCIHFDNCHESEEVREYLSLTCPLCVLKIKKKCSDIAFIPCCIEKMKNRKLFKDIDEAADFLTTCRHFKYKRAYLNFSLEGNLFENTICHSIRYFASINCRYDACVQNLNYMQLMTQWVKKGIRV